MDRIKKQAIAVFSGCLFAMAAVVLYGIIQDERDRKAIEKY